MPRRYGVLIVAVAIVAMGGALLLTAVNRTRAAAARMTCVGNLKQLGVSLHNYESVHGTLPSGTIPNTDLPPDERLSWVVLILPYIEENNVYKHFDLKRGPADGVNLQPAGNRFKLLVCPATGEHRSDDGVHHWESPKPLTHYVGVAGVGSGAATFPKGHPRAGVFGYDRRTKFIREDFPDGTSNTLMLIETGRKPGHWAFGGPATVRAFEPGTAPYVGPTCPFGGFHNGFLVWQDHSCNVCLADGSCRALTSKTDPVVLEALATVAGREILPANW